MQVCKRWGLFSHHALPFLISGPMWCFAVCVKVAAAAPGYCKPMDVTLAFVIHFLCLQRVKKQVLFLVCVILLGLSTPRSPWKRIQF